MDYEKKYKEALERARVIKSKILQSHLSTESCKAVSNYIDEIIPELAESEDERIRQKLIRNVSILAYHSGLEVVDLSAWLEKQKEQKPACGDDFKWTSQDERCRSKLIDVLELADAAYPTTKDSRDELWEWLKELPMKFPNKNAFIMGILDNDDELSPTEEILGVDGNPTCYKQKPSWCEEDEHRRKDAIYFLKSAKRHYADTSEIEKTIAWLKSLRPQLQHRNTYYDIIHNILDMLKGMDFMKITPEHRVSLLNDIRVKCKNADECATILDEPHWKPSEEQMEALQNAVALTACDKELVRLYNQLKKL